MGQACQLRPRSPTGLWPLNFVLYLLPGHVHLSQHTEAQEQPRGWQAGQPEGEGATGEERESLPDTRNHELPLQAKTQCSKGSLGAQSHRWGVGSTSAMGCTAGLEARKC